MRITDVLKQDRIKVCLTGTIKDELFTELIELASPDAPREVRDSHLAAVREREGLASTGVGKGVAIPHGKSDSLEELVGAFGITREPVEYNAIDGAPVRIVFLILAPRAEQRLYMRFLARVSRVLNNRVLRDQLLACAAAGSVFRTFSEYEDAHF